MSIANLTIPEHVPADLVVDYDTVGGTQVAPFPPAGVDELRERYRAFYSPHSGGFWVLTRFDDIRSAYEDYATFPQQGTLSALKFGRVMIPLTLNPPVHKEWRRVLQPMFTPGRVRKLESLIRDTARDLLKEIGPRGQCDVSSEYALSIPAATFCGLLGLPREGFASFNKLAFDLIYTPDEISKVEGMEAGQKYREAKIDEINDFIRDLIPVRRANLGDDSVSYLIERTYEGRPLTDDEIVNIASLLFFAGTDSTGALLTYAIMFLAANPGHKQQLLDDPTLIPAAADELIRYHGFHHSARDVARDVEFAGVNMKRGDRILLPTGGANHDPRAWPNAEEVQFGRRTPGHVTFGAGAHRCLGAPLATLQVKIGLEEFLKVLPDVHLDPNKSIEYAYGINKSIPLTVPVLYSPANVVQPATSVH
ncbi:cytochrome P450 [Rhodococcus koreensis]